MQIALGFFHIPHDPSQKQRNHTHTALIRVIDDKLFISNVISDVERLIPGVWMSNIEATGNNTFRIIFLSR
jgi:hypothetical protein